MIVSELEALILKVRGMDPSYPLDPNEEWDSLDHIAIITALININRVGIQNIDLSEANSLSKLSNILNIE